MNGVVTRVFLPKGYAFVQGEDGVDYLLHATEFRASWSGEVVHTGVQVTFTPRDNGNGGNKMRATEVVLR